MPHEPTVPDIPEINQRLKVAMARTSQLLSDADMDAVRKNIARSLDLRRQLRAVALENHDEPEHGFDPRARRLPVVQDRYS